MSDELFPIEPSRPPALLLARQRLAAAQAAFDRASEIEDDTGEPISGEARRELADAAREVNHWEREELRK
jgi:hypothetical protein